MPRKVGRNEPCPCGSGRKHKRCCLPKNAPTRRHFQPDQSGLARDAEVDRWLTDAILAHAVDRFGDDWLKSAEADFPGSRNRHREQIFIPWAMYCFEYGGRSAADWFMETEGEQLTREVRIWLEAQRSAPLSIWEITGVEEGRGLHLHDQLTGEKCFVDEDKGTYGVTPHCGVLARVTHYGSRSLLVGVDSRPLPPIPTMYVVKQTLQEIATRHDGRPSREELNNAETAVMLIALWEEALSQIVNRPAPKVQNTDGEDLLLTTEHYTFEPSKRQHVVAKIAGFQGAQLDDDGNGSRPTVVRIVRRSKSGMLDEVVVARLEIEHSRLRVETNSRKRTVSFRRRLLRVLGDTLTRGMSVHSDPESLLEETPRQEPLPMSSPPPGGIDLVRQFKEQHYERWPDIPLPALDGKTPRAAASDAVRRPVLAALIKELEQQESRLPEDERFDCAPLWRLLKK